MALSIGGAMGFSASGWVRSKQRQNSMAAVSADGRTV
jgi:hypothetical protein